MATLPVDLINNDATIVVFFFVLFESLKNLFVKEGLKTLNDVKTSPPLKA